MTSEWFTINKTGTPYNQLLFCIMIIDLLVYCSHSKIDKSVDQMACNWSFQVKCELYYMADLCQGLYLKNISAPTVPMVDLWS